MPQRRTQRSTDDKIDKVSFEDPPARRATYDWETISAVLKAKPMEWALIFKGDRTSVVNALRQGAITPMHPDLGFEFRTANNIREPVRTCDLYVRFNPDNVAPLRATIHSIRPRKDR